MTFNDEHRQLHLIPTSRTSTALAMPTSSMQNRSQCRLAPPPPPHPPNTHLALVPPPLPLHTSSIQNRARAPLAPPPHLDHLNTIAAVVPPLLVASDSTMTSDLIQALLMTKTKLFLSLILLCNRNLALFQSLFLLPPCNFLLNSQLKPSNYLG